MPFESIGLDQSPQETKGEQNSQLEEHEQTQHGRGWEHELGELVPGAGEPIHAGKPLFWEKILMIRMPLAPRTHTHTHNSSISFTCWLALIMLIKCFLPSSYGLNTA